MLLKGAGGLRDRWLVELEGLMSLYRGSMSN